VIEKALEVSLEVGEPEQDVVDAALFDLLEHVLARSRIRRGSVLALDLRHDSLLLARPDGVYVVAAATLRTWSSGDSGSSRASFRHAGGRSSRPGSCSSSPAPGSRCTRTTISRAAAGRCPEARLCASPMRSTSFRGATPPTFVVFVTGRGIPARLTAVRTLVARDQDVRLVGP